VNEIDKELINRKIYKKPENFEGTIRHILITGKNSKKIFGIIIKGKTRDEIQEKDMKRFQELKNDSIKHLSR